MQLPCLSDGQLVVSSGDTLLSFDASEVAFSESGVTGLAYPGSVELASDHGVYIPAQAGSGENLRRVADFLQKPTYDELEKCNALDAAKRAFVDTGVMNFALDAIKALMDASGLSLEDGEVLVGEDSLCESLINVDVALDIYREIPFAMLSKYAGQALDILQQIPFSVCLLPYCEFFHIGTSRQLLQNFYASNYTASAYDFQNFSRSRAVDKSRLENAFVYNSSISTAAVEVSVPTLIEGCRLEGEIRLDGENVLTGIPKGVSDIKLKKGICVTCVPVKREVEHAASLSEKKSGWVSVIYGVEDSFKRLAEDNSATFLNHAFLSWMENKEILPIDLWRDNEPYDLWNARLFPFSPDPAESMQIALSLQDHNGSPSGKVGRGDSAKDWSQSPHMSLREILQSIDYEVFLGNHSNLCQETNLEGLATILTPESDLSSEEILSWCMETDGYTTAARITMALIEQSEDVLFQARLYRLLSNILDAGYSMLDARWKEQHRMSSAKCEDMAFELIREAIGRGLKNNRPMEQLTSRPIDQPTSPTDQKIQIRSDEVVWVCAPARLDFAGGWSDTPPYCLERGGSVLNAAVRLNGQYPTQVIGKLHPEFLIRINSIDLRENIVISETSDMMSYQDPTDWSALPKAAFAVTGIIPAGARHTVPLRDILKRLGGGIDLTLFSAVPSGSGLGTSSILGSAIIACLSRMLGQELTQEELFNRTLYMEQLMTTGGGWQDQIGGVVGGVKHIRTEPGLFQVPSISWTDLKVRPDMDLSERFLLYYTGYRRMAKGILRSVVGRYLDRDSTTLQTIDRLREVSLEMKEELDHRNIDAFGKKIARVWELNKTLDPGTSNEDIEAVLNRISHLVHGAKLLGAGGGGFLFMVSKGVEQTQQIREIMANNPPNNRARFFDFDIDDEGLKVSVL